VDATVMLALRSLFCYRTLSV